MAPRPIFSTGGSGLLNRNPSRYLLYRHHGAANVDVGRFTRLEKDRLVSLSSDIRDRRVVYAPAQDVGAVPIGAADLPPLSLAGVFATTLMEHAT